MSLIERFLVNMAIRKVGAKMVNFLQRFDGLKTLIGILIIVAYYAVPAFTSVHPPESILTLGYSILGVGLAHKGEKAFGLITKILDVLKASVDALSKQKED